MSGPTVLHLITNADLGGAQEVLWQLSTGLREHCNLICALGDNGPTAERLRAASIDVVILRHMKRQIAPVSDLQAIAEVRAISKRLRANIIHAHSSKAGMIARMLGVETPVIYHVHGWGFKPGVPIARRSIVFGIERALARRARMNLCVSAHDAILAETSLAIPKERIRIVHNGVPDRPSPRKQRGPVFRAVMVARFQEPKRHDIVLRAMTLLPQSVHLDFVGDGICLSQAREMASRLNLLGRVSFHGQISDPHPVIAGADVGLLLSNYEGLPMSVIEYMRAGLPVVASAVGGIPEMVRDAVHGYLCENTSASLARAISRIAASEELAAKFGSAARDRFVTCFTRTRMVANVLTIYDELLN